MIIMHWIKLQNLLHYIILTIYYIVNEIVRWLLQHQKYENENNRVKTDNNGIE